MNIICQSHLSKRDFIIYFRYTIVYKSQENKNNPCKYNKKSYNMTTECLIEDNNKNYLQIKLFSYEFESMFELNL